MVLAVSLVIEGAGQTDVGFQLFQSVREAADRVLHRESIEIKNLPFLTLVVCLSLFFILNLSSPLLFSSEC